MTSLLKEQITNEAKELFTEIQRIRRELHANPELSYKEYDTASYISNYLHKLDIKHKTGICGTGIIGYIDGEKGSGVNIALRAEMDALPLHEDNDVPYRSRNKGVMHACGHDAHMAMLLGTATLLNNLRSHFKGKVILLFQPGEEQSPGGASIIMNSDELTKPEPDIVIAQHILPEMMSGTVGYREGIYMAAADEIHITIKGKGGHAALPHMVTDQILIASKLIVKIKETIEVRSKELNIPTVLGIGNISGKGATNVIPEIVHIDGTFRTFDEKWREEAAAIIRKIAEEKAREYGIEIDIDISKGYPVLINNKELAKKAIKLTTELIGREKIVPLDIRMTSDDFSFYGLRYPALYYRIGAGKPDQKMKALHTSRFDIDEEALSTGVANLTWITMGLLNK